LGIVRRKNERGINGYCTFDRVLRGIEDYAWWNSEQHDPRTGVTSATEEAARPLEVFGGLDRYETEVSQSEPLTQSYATIVGDFRSIEIQHMCDAVGKR
jgi:hypothetical protein